MTKPNKRLASIMLAAALLISVPFIAMELTDEVRWSLSDFAAAAVLLFGGGLLCELVLRKAKTTAQRVVICSIIFGGLILVWAELAVGIVGTRFAGS